jgi:glyoxylase-like metal-dependent hydrolase (beta-lactamase superfamily II)
VSGQPEDWTEPGAFEVAAGVHRIPLPLPNDGLRAVNVYAIETAGRLVLVDAGWDVPDAFRLLSEALAVLGAGLADIERFLVTHVHRDHYTQAISVRRQVGTRVSLGAGERPGLEVARQPERASFEPQVRQLRRCGAATLIEEMAAVFGTRPPETDRSIWELPDDWIEPGPVALAGRRLEAIETPGHTAGHVVFRDPAAGLLFAGDHVLPTITPSIGFEPVPVADPLGDFLSSLAKVRALPDAMLLPAHGAVAPSVHARIDELVDHHGRRLDETEAAVAAGASTAFEAAGRLHWTRRLRRFDELDIFNRMLATTETLAHLDLLAIQGRLHAASEDGVTLYSTRAGDATA